MCVLLCYRKTVILFLVTPRAAKIHRSRNNIKRYLTLNFMKYHLSMLGLKVGRIDCGDLIMFW